MLKWLQNRTRGSRVPTPPEAGQPSAPPAGPTASLPPRTRAISMLHDHTLSLLHHFASRCDRHQGDGRGGILEIGPYIGGSTLAIASAIGPDTPFLSIEMGGAHDHPQLPSTDILADLRQNVAEAGLTDRVQIVVGASTDSAVPEAVRTRLGDRKIELLFIDADGHVGRDIALFEPMLAESCVIVLDDYHTLDAGNVKETLVKAWVDEAADRGEVTTLGLVPWATWIGVRGRHDPAAAANRLGLTYPSLMRTAGR